MMRSNFFVTFLALFIFSINCLAVDGKYYYIVKTKDTLSQVLYKAGIKPLYSKSGAIVTLQKLNSKNIVDLNKIYPGQLIYLNKDFVEKAVMLKLAVVSDQSEVVLVETNNNLNRDLASLSTELKSEDVQQSLTVNNLTENVEDQLGRFSFNLGFQYSRIDAIDVSTQGSSTFLTDISPKYGIQWESSWNKTWSSVISVALIQEQVVDDTSTVVKTIDHASGYRKKISIEIQRHWDLQRDSTTTIAAGIKDQMFSRGLTPTAISLDRIPNNYLGLIHYQDLFNLNKLSVFGKIEYNYLLSASGAAHKLEPGSFTQFSFGVEHIFKNFEIQSEIFYGVSDQNSQLVKQRETSVGAHLNAVWSFSP